MAKYRKKPVIIEAWKWEGNRLLAGAPKWVLAYRDSGNAKVRVKADGTLSIPTLEGIHTANIGDWIIQGIKGEIYPCKPDIFEATYELIPDRLQRPRVTLDTPFTRKEKTHNV